MRMQAAKTVVIPPMKALRFIIIAMLAGMILYAGIALALTLPSTAPKAYQALLYAAVLAALGVTSLVANAVASRSLAAKAAAPGFDSGETDRRRLGAYSGLVVVRAVLAEAFGLTGITFMLFTGEVYFLAAPLLSAAILIRLLPRGGTPHAFDHSIGPGASSHSGAIEP